MKIYLQTSEHAYSELQNSLNTCVNFFESKGYEFLDSSTFSVLRKGKKFSDISGRDDYYENEKHLFHEADLVIIEASTPSFGMGALFGLSVMFKKRTLCLYKQASKEVSDVILSYKAALVGKIEYTEEDLEEQLLAYEKTLKKKTLRKFNFVATEEIVDFISSESELVGKSKSEFLRDLIEKHL